MFHQVEVSLASLVGAFAPSCALLCGSKLLRLDASLIIPLDHLAHFPLRLSRSLALDNGIPCIENDISELAKAIFSVLFLCTIPL